MPYAFHHKKAARTIMSEPLFGAYISFLKYGIFFMM